MKGHDDVVLVQRNALEGLLLRRLLLLLLLMLLMMLMLMLVGVAEALCSWMKS